jgi:putative SOS response-associated peptidase YedK
MCGYVERTRVQSGVAYGKYLEASGIQELPLGRFYPGSRMSGVVIQRGDCVTAVDAIWWYKLHWDREAWRPLRKVTSFNTRNLDSPLWKKPLRTHRCIVPATAIVETIEDPADARKRRSYLMDAPAGIVLGGVYGEYEHAGEITYSCSIITLEPHARFSRYHDRATPLFLPVDKTVLDRWLDPTFTDFDYFRMSLLDRPRLPTEFVVTPVNNSQGLEPIGEPERLAADTGTP